MSDHICVFVKNTRIGQLIPAAKPTEAARFTFSEDYLALGNDKPILSLAQAQCMNSGITVSTHRGLPSFFSYLLPYGDYYAWLCDLFAIKPEDTFLFLSIYGGNVFGGVQLLPQSGDSTSHMGMLEEIRLGKFPNSWQYMALPGHHTKVAMIQENDQFILARNPLQAQFYLQLASQNEPFFVDNVYLMSHLANAIGLATPACFKVDNIKLPKDIPGLHEQNTLIMGRVDRDEINGIPIHAETMAQAMGMVGIDLAKPATFADILSFIQTYFKDERLALRTVISQMVFHLLIGNAHADLNRFAIIYSDDNTPRISPLLQPFSTLLYTQTHELALPINGVRQFSKVTLADFQSLAEHCDLDKKHIKQIVLEIVQQASDTWPNVISNIAVPTPLYDALHRHWEDIAKHF